MAAEAGHTVTPLQGSLVPLQGIIAAGIPCVRLQGLSLRNVSLTVFENDKKIYTDFGELLFTHFGVSGPLVLSASAHMRYFTKKRYRLEIDLKPALDEQQLDKRLLADFAKYANHDFQNGLDDLLPQKLIPVVIELSGIPGRQKVHDLTREQRQSLLRVLKHFPVEVSAPCPVTDAIVTSGGVKVGRWTLKPWSPSLLKICISRENCWTRTPIPAALTYRSPGPPAVWRDSPPRMRRNKGENSIENHQYCH